MTRQVAATIYLALTALVVLFHLSLILGAPFGAATLGGHWPGVLPPAGRAVSAISIAVLLVLARIVAEAGDLMPILFPPASLWAVAMFVALSAVLNTLTPSPVERAIWLPLVLVQGACVWRLLRG